MPIVKAILYFGFGQVKCESAEVYTFVYENFKENIKTINNQMKISKKMVGSDLTVCDIYLVLSQIEMQQCLMDTNLRNSLQFFNGLFKEMTQENDIFKKRMGNIKLGKKQIMPVFAADAK